MPRQMINLLNKFIKVYAGVDFDRYELDHDLVQFIKANTGELVDLRTVKGREILKYVLTNLKHN